MAELNFKFEVDDSSFEQAVNKSIGDIHRLANECNLSGKEVDNAFKDLGKQIAESLGEASVTELQSMLKTAVDNVQALNEKMAQMKGAEGFDEQSDEAKILASQIERATQKANEYKNMLLGAQSVKLDNAPDASKFEQASKSVENTANSASNLSKAFSMLPQGVQNGINGIKKLTQACKTFILTPIGAVITAIVVALKTLSTYFTSSAKGQEVYAKGMAYVSSIMSSFKDVLIGIGDKIVKLFTEPKQALADFGNGLKTFLIDRIKGFATMIGGLGGALKNLFNRDWDGLKESVKQIKDGFLEAYAINDVADAVSDFGKKANESAKAMVDLKDRELKLRKQRSKWQIEEARLDNQIAEARNKMYESKDGDARLKATAEAQELIKQKYASLIAMAKEELAITLQQNAQHENTIEDYEKEDELRANIIRLEAQMNQEMARFVRQETTASANSLKAEQERARLALDARQQQLQLQSDSLEKTIEQYNIEKEIALLELEQQGQTWREEQGGSLTDAQENYIKAMRDFYDQFSQTKITDYVFNQYATALEKAQKEYDTTGKDINTLKTSGASQNVINGAIEKQQMQALNVMKEKVDAEFNNWLNSLATMTTEGLESALIDAEKVLLEQEAKGGTSEDLVKARARVSALKDEVKKAKQEIGRESDIKTFDNLSTMCKDGAQGFRDLAKSSDESFNKILNDIADTLDSVQTVINGIQQLVKSSVEAMQRTSEAGASAVKAVEDISVILAIIGAVVGLIQKLKSSQANDPLKEISDSARQLTDNLKDLKVQMDLTLDNGNIFGDNAKSNMNQTISNIRKYGEEYAKAIDEAVFGSKQGKETENGGFLNAGSTFYTSMASTVHDLRGMFGDEMAESFINSKKSADDYGKSLQDLAKNLMDYKVQTQHSTWFRKAEYDTIGNLLDDYNLVGETEEETFQNLKKFAESGGKLWDKIDEPVKELINDTLRYYEAQQEAQKALEDSLKNYFGQYQNSLKEAIKTGFKDGSEEGKQSFLQNVSTMIGDFYLDMLLGKDKISELLNGMGEEVSKMMMSGSSDEEIADYMATKAKDVAGNYERLESIYSNVMDEVNRTLGVEENISNMGSLSGAIQGASQESIDLLAGYCNAVRINQVDSIDILRNQLIQLQGINTNTFNINDVLTAFKSSFDTYTHSDGARAVGA